MSKRSFKIEKLFVSVGSCIISLTTMGLVQAMGRLFTDIRDTFDSTRSQAAAVQTSLTGIGLGTGIFAGLLLNRLGARKTGFIGSCCLFIGMLASYFATSTIFLIMSVGVIGALGFSFHEITSNVIVSQHFKGRSRTQVLTVVSAVAGVSGMVYPYLMDYTLYEYGLRGTFLIFSGILCHNFISCYLWFPPATLKTNKTVLTSISKDIDENTRKNDGDETRSVTSESRSNVRVKRNICTLYRDKVFIFYILGLILVDQVVKMYAVFIADIYNDKGYPDNVSFGIFLMNGCALFGRIMPMLLMRIRLLSKLDVFPPMLSAFLGLGGITLLMTVDSSYTLFVVSAIVGFSNGMLLTSFYIITVELFEVELMSIAIGTLNSLSGILLTIAGPINGMLRDNSGSYFAMYLSFLACLSTSLLFFLLTHIFHVKKKKKISRGISITVPTP